MQVLSASYGHVFGRSVAALEYEGAVMSDGYFHEVRQADVPAKDAMCMGSFQTAAEAERAIEVLTELHPKRRFKIMRRPRLGRETSPATVIDLPVCEVDVMVGAGVNRL
jgi:hypothetical protein